MTIAALCLLLAYTAKATAQEHSEKLPSAILIMLNSEQNRIKALEKAHRYKDVEEVKGDAAAIIEMTKSDLKEHFNYCPVYYFTDSNFTLVKKHALAGIIMNADGSPAADVPEHNYLIAYYGYPTKQKEEGTLKQGVTIYDEQGTQIRFVRKWVTDGPAKRKDRKKYTYTSRHFDINFRPFAGFLTSYCKRMNGERK